MDVKFLFVKLIAKITRNPNEFVNNYYRKQGVVIGKDCNICSNILTTEPYLLEIGDNVTISTDVLFITHDASVGKIFGKEIASDICGKIRVGNNCFIGARSTVLYGVTLANNIIVAAGSTVTKSFVEENIIIAGNPAKIIGHWEDFANKIKNNTYMLHGKKGNKAKAVVLSNVEKLIIR